MQDQNTKETWKKLVDEHEDEDFYSESQIMELVDDDEITPEEEGFMYGWLEADMEEAEQDE